MAEDEDLLKPFKTLMEQGHHYLDWSSGQFEMETRHPDDAVVESLNFTHFILFADPSVSTHWWRSFQLAYCADSCGWQEKAALQWGVT